MDDAEQAQRKERREQAAGTLTVQLTNPPRTLQGELLDVSPRGFRIKHQCSDLVPGQTVRVLYSWGKVWARVVWSKEHGLDYESGFELG